MAATLGELNPFRYRGYYYDAESGLYYLRSRYYDPETFRFLNADSIVSTNDLTGMNPVSYTHLQQAVDSGLIQLFPLN